MLSDAFFELFPTVALHDGPIVDVNSGDLDADGLFGSGSRDGDVGERLHQRLEMARDLRLD